MLPKRSYPVTGWHEEPINKKHDQEVFDCGEAPLNDFLRRYARRSHELGGAKTFLAIDDADDKTILGFYSLSPASVDYARTPEIIRRGWHDTTFRASAGHRRTTSAGGGQALPRGLGGSWRRGCGAVPLLDAPLSLLLPLATIETALKKAGKY